MDNFLKLFELSAKQACLLSKYSEALERRPKVTMVNTDVKKEELTIEDRVAERKAKEAVDFLQREWLAELEVYYEALKEVSEEIQDILDIFFAQAEI